MKRKWEESQSDGECIELLIGKNSVMKLLMLRTICFEGVICRFLDGNVEIIHCCLIYTFQKLETGMSVGNYTRILEWFSFTLVNIQVSSKICLVFCNEQSVAVLSAVQISFLFFWWQRFIVSGLSLIDLSMMFQVTTSGPSDNVYHSKWFPANFCLYNYSFVCFTWDHFWLLSLYSFVNFLTFVQLYLTNWRFV